MDPDNQKNDSELLKEDQSPPSGTGPFIGAIIIILLMAVGAFYFWNARLDIANDNPPPLILGNDTEVAPSSDPASGFPPQQTSDSPESINADIEAMDLRQFNSQNDANLQGFQQNAQ